MAREKRDPVKPGREAVVEAVDEMPIMPGDAPPSGEGASMQIVKSDEQWNNYTLADGTTLRIRPIVTEVVRYEERFTSDGDPLYGMKATLIVDTKAPKTLRRR